MSAVTLQEIADLCCDQFGVTLAELHEMHIRGNWRVHRHVTAARRAILLLTHEHTQTGYTQIKRFFHKEVLHISQIVIEAKAARSEDETFAAHLAAIEDQIDALHDRRMAERDRQLVRA